MPRRFQRHAYAGRDGLLRELKLFGYLATPDAQHLPLGPHEHDAWEICLIESGNVQWWVEHEVHDLHRGDLYITRPHETHGGMDAVIQPSSLYWLILRFPDRGALPGLTRAATTALARDFDALRYRCFTASPAVRRSFAALYNEHRTRDAHCMLMARAALHELLINVVRDHDRAAARNLARGQPPSAAIQRAIDRMATNLHEPIPIEDVAAAVDLGVSRFHERFLAEVGLPPNEYRTRLRIRRARELLLRTDDSITTIAHDLGFSSSQYFATVFGRIVGVSPSAYRRKAHH